MERGADKGKRKFAQTKEPLRFVVEGIGDVVTNYYEPAFKALKAQLAGKREIHVTFADKSDFWMGDANLSRKMRSIIKSVRSWGADYLDKSDPTDLRRYEALETDIVIIATPDFTHAEVANVWLRHNPHPEQIFVEKPLEASLNAARKLLGNVEPYDDSILAFDHYRARLLPTRTQMDVLLGFLGRGLKRFTFYFLEDHSGGDPDPKYHSVGRNGPIENEQRVKSVNQGVILDGMPHMVALLAHFGRVETLRVMRVGAGQYIGVDTDPNKRTEIAKETFVDVGFAFADHAGNRAEGTAYVGKGVRGVKALGPAHDHNVKMLEVEGLNGNKASFDLRSSGQGASRAHLIDAGGKTQFEFPLNAKPYETFLGRIANGSYLDDRLALNVEVGKRILEILEDMRFPIPDKDQIPTYPCGMKDVRESLYLEEILELLKPLYGKNRP